MLQLWRYLPIYRTIYYSIIVRDEREIDTCIRPVKPTKNDRLQHVVVALIILCNNINTLCIGIYTRRGTKNIFVIFSGTHIYVHLYDIIILRQYTIVSTICLIYKKLKSYQNIIKTEIFPSKPVSDQKLIWLPYLWRIEK